MDGVEAILAILERFRNMKAGEAPPPAFVAPQSPSTAARPAVAPRPQNRPQAPAPAPPPVQAATIAPEDSLLPFRGGAKSIARAIVAAEVLAPPVGLRETPRF
jgi:hypothetical protein